MAAFVLVAAVPTLSPGLRATVGDWFAAEYFQNAGGPAVDAGSPSGNGPPERSYEGSRRSALGRLVR